VRAENEGDGLEEGLPNTALAGFRTALTESHSVFNGFRSNFGKPVMSVFTSKSKS
jgi:hypothetical protein